MTFAYDDSKSEWRAAKLAVFNDQANQFEPVSLAEDEEPNKDKLNDLKNALDDLRIVDVERKPEGLSQDLKAQKDFASNEQAVRSLADRGFMPVQIGEEFEILSTDGDVLCQMKDGVEYVLRFGKLVLSSDVEGEADAGSTGGGEASDPKATETKKEEGESRTGVNRYLFVAARFNENVIEKPKLEELPEIPETASEAENGAQEPAGTKDSETPSQQPSDSSADGAAAGDAGTAAEGNEETNNEDQSDEAEQPADASSGDSAAAQNDASTEGDSSNDATAEEPGEEQSTVEPSADAQGAEGSSENQGPADDKELANKELEKVIEKRKEIEKENQRKLDEYQDKIKKGTERVAELNNRFGDWYYVISDQVYKKIRLTRDDVIRKKENKEDEKKEDGSAETTDSQPNSPLGELNELEKGELEK
jgi:hypothetical protein